MNHNPKSAPTTSVREAWDAWPKQQADFNAAAEEALESDE